MRDILAGVSGAHNGLFSDVLKYNAFIRENIKLKVLSYLQEKGVSYPDQRKGKHQVVSEGISPLEHDVVAYKDSTRKIHLRVITGMKSSNVAEIRII